MKLTFVLILLTTLSLFGQDTQALKVDRDRLIETVLKLEADFAKAMEDFAELKKAFSEASEKPVVPDQRALVADLQKRLDQAAAQLRTMESVAQNSSYKTAEALKKVIEGELAKLNQALGGEKALLKEARERLTKLERVQGQLIQVESELKTAKSDRAQLEEQLKELQSENEELTTQMNSLLSRLTSAEVEKKAAVDQAILLRAKVKTLTQRSEEALKEAVFLKESLRKKTDHASHLEQETKKLRDQLASHQARLVNAKKENGSLSGDGAKLRKEKDHLVTKLSASESELKKARLELGRLQLQLEAGRKKMHALKVRLAKVSPVSYAVGKADVQEQQERALREVRDVLGIFPNARFEIVGHTCDLGSVEANQTLSAARAEALLVFLNEKGIPKEILTARGVADSDPVVPNSTEANRQKNRRVEIGILD